MNCPNCGAPVDEGAKFCTKCGTKLDAYAAKSYTTPTATTYVNVPTGGYNLTPDQLPPQYRPLSPWAYFGYSLLFAIPLVGLICLIVFSFSEDNINRRNFARSFWCALLLAIAIGVVVLVIALMTGASFAGSAYGSRYW